MGRECKSPLRNQGYGGSNPSPPTISTIWWNLWGDGVNGKRTRLESEQPIGRTRPSAALPRARLRRFVPGVHAGAIVEGTRHLRMTILAARAGRRRRGPRRRSRDLEPPWCAPRSRAVAGRVLLCSTVVVSPAFEAHTLRSRQMKNPSQPCTCGSRTSSASTTRPTSAATAATTSAFSASTTLQVA